MSQDGNVLNRLKALSQDGNILNRLKALSQDGETFELMDCRRHIGTEAAGTCPNKIENVFLISEEQYLWFCKMVIFCC